jgi:transcriptional regulator with XRE-family HTH domain
MELHQLIAIGIHKELKRNGKLQKWLASESGISDREISGFLHGKKSFSVKRINKLLRPLGLDMSGILKQAIIDVYGLETPANDSKLKERNENLEKENQKLIEMLYEATIGKKTEDRKKSNGR